VLAIRNVAKVKEAEAIFRIKMRTAFACHRVFFYSSLISLERCRTGHIRSFRQAADH
jgi:hypothetical protein